MAIPVKVSISIDKGKPLADFHNVTIKQELFTHHYFEVTVPYEMLGAKPDGFLHKAHQQYCGKEISIEFTPKKQDAKLPLKFLGIITHIALSNTQVAKTKARFKSRFKSTLKPKSKDTANNFNHSFVLSGYSPTYLLEDGTQRRTFVDKTLKEIFEEVLVPYPANLLPRGPLAPQHQQPVAYTVQYDESPYAFLQRLANEYGEWFYYDGQKLCLGPPSTVPSLTHTVENTHKFTLGVELRPSSFKLSHYDYRSHQRYRASSASQDLTQLDLFTDLALQQSDLLFTQPAQFFPSRDVREGADLTTAIREKKESQASRLVTFQGTGEKPGCTVGEVIAVEGSYQGGTKHHDYGQYRLLQVMHLVTGDMMYHNEFEALPTEAKRPPTNPLVQLPQGMPELADVLDIDDPEELGRIRVCYKWYHGKENMPACITDWIRVSTPYSGKEVGQLFIPEVGSQVLVGYEDGRPESPVVLGNLYHKIGDTAYTSTDNEFKGICTAGGNIIEFNDEKGNEYISIFNRDPDKEGASLKVGFSPDGYIDIRANGLIRVQTNDELFLKAKNIVLHADKSIKFSTNNKLVFDSSKDNLALTSDKVEIKGATTKVTGSTTTIIKAPLVKIN